MIKNKKLQINVVTLLLLCLGLCITSFAISYTIIKVDNNYFRTGGIDIDLNGNAPIIPECMMNPGDTVKKEFYIKNDGSWEVFYKLYFEELKGDLADVLKIKIYKQDSPETILLEGKISDFVDADELYIAGQLEVGQKENLIASFHFPEDAGNEYEDARIEFKMSAIAVQTKNNDTEKFKFE